MTGSSRWLLLLRRLILPSMLLLISIIPASMAVDSLSRGASISNPQTLISSGDTFALGFFSPGNSTNSSYYLGIWYNRIPVRTVVWVANRVAPIPASATNISLTLTDAGDLAITSRGTSTPLWSAGINGKNLINPLTAQLTEEGNLVVADGRGFVAWQSFDHPTDTLVPGMKLRGNRRTGLLTNLTSWRSTTDPAPGDYSLVLDVRGVPQLILYTGNVIRWRSGPWMGDYWSTFPEMATASSLTVFNYSYVDAGDEVTYEFFMRNKSMVSRLMINQTGGTSEWSYTINPGGSWNRFWIAPGDLCDPMGMCGGYGLCGTDLVSGPCQCMRGFVPRNPGDWRWREGRAGCRRTTALDCGSNGTTDGFVRIGRLKLPDTVEAVENLRWGAAECSSACLRNCSCTAYSAARGDGSGCLMWFGELMDVRTPIDAAPDLFVRLGAADLDKVQSKGNNRKVIYGTIAGVVGTVVLLAICFCIIRRWKKKGANMYISRDFEVPSFEFTTILAATSNFSIKNKLGEGGFGPVYKGNLQTGQDVAIKRLSTTSTQGIEEFRNEVAVIAKLQHRNLVKLLGFCLHGNERMLIYEFMPHRSLDHVLFDKTKSSILEWETRYQIILGIARGILYLHEDSRLRIIHRDLKAGNILLDKDMNPKISDFGMARIFRGDETEANTKRVVGTYGYMSPEYALDGIFSVKSDVFSFGVLLLEIISGLKNRAIFQVDRSPSLLGQAWNLWRENRSLELVDSCMHSFPASEVLNCIKIGLICVQEHPDDRPTMSFVVTMLTTANTGSLLKPKQPGYATLKDHGKKEETSCSNDV